MGETVTPPVVTLFPHGTVIDYGSSSSRTFSASVTQPATITFYFDGVAQAPVVGQWASFSCVNVATYHQIRVVASNENGSSEDSCDWYVRDEPCVSPVVNRASPTTKFVCDAIGESRTFTASVTSDPNFPPTIALYLDDQFVVPSASATLTASAGTHMVKVVAISCGMSEASWIWYVPSTPPSDPYHISPVYQRPVVTKVTQNIPDVIVDTTTPLSITVSVDQPSTLTLKIDGWVYATQEESVPNAQVSFTINLAYLNNPDNIGKHTIEITASNSNGTSNAVTYMWNLVGLTNALLIEWYLPWAVFQWRSRVNGQWGAWQNGDWCNLNAAMNFAYSGILTDAECTALADYQWKHLASDPDTYAQPYVPPGGSKGLTLYHVRRQGPTPHCSPDGKDGHEMLALYNGPDTDEGRKTWENWQLFQYGISNIGVGPTTSCDNQIPLPITGENDVTIVIRPINGIVGDITNGPSLSVGAQIAGFYITSSGNVNPM